MIEFRAATFNDHDFLYNLKKAALKDSIEKVWGPWNEQFQREYFEDHFSLEGIQIILYNGEDAGAIKISTKEDEIDIDIIEILPRYQNRGIGSFVLEREKRRAINENKNLYLQVLKVNLDAKRLYERLGFQVTGKTEMHYQMMMR